MSGEELNFDEYDEIVNTAIKQIYRDNECIALQRIIKRQQKEIEELKEQIIELKEKEIIKKSLIPTQEKFEDYYNYISKDKIREIINKYVNIEEHLSYTSQELYGEDLKNMIIELLEENKSNENNI